VKGGISTLAVRYRRDRILESVQLPAKVIRFEVYTHARTCTRTQVRSARTRLSCAKFYDNKFPPLFYNLAFRWMPRPRLSRFPARMQV